MSRRVVCSHGSSLGTAVQYAGQGKVTLLCVRARARVRASQCPPPQSPLLLTLARAHVYVQSILPSSSLFSSWLYHSSNRDRERGLTASEEQRRATGTGRERRILEERGAEYRGVGGDSGDGEGGRGGKLQPTSHDYTIKSRVQNERGG